MTAKLRTCAAISGRATVLRAVVEASRSGLLPVDFVAFFADRPCSGLELAAEYRIPGECVDFNSFTSRDGFDKAFEDKILQHNPDLVLLHYNRVISSRLLQELPGRILNTHYSLLPSFPGFRAIQRALRSGVRFTGVTIHSVTQEVDGGPILAQACCSVHPGETESCLGLRLCVIAVYLTLGLLADAPSFGQQGATRLELPNGEEAILSLPISQYLREFADGFVVRELLTSIGQ